MKTLKSLSLFAVVTLAALFATGSSASACNRHGGWYGGYYGGLYQPVVYRTVTPVIVQPRLGYWVYDALGNRMWVPYTPTLTAFGY